MMHSSGLFVAMVVSLTLAGGLPAKAEEKKESGEQERRVKEAEVPAAALSALKKLAGASTITELAEEIEHGHRFFEASWKRPEGNVDALVTEAGDVVEIEERIAADKVPATVRTALANEAGKDATVHFEKKTFFVYEAHFKKDGKNREVMLTPDGRLYHEDEGEDGGDEDEDE